MAKVTITFLEMITACLANCSLVRNTHARIERAMGNHRAVTIEVEKLSVGNFDDGLANNIVVRPGKRDPLLVIGSAASQSSLAPLSGKKKGNHLQYAEFQLLDHFGDTINNLGLAQVNLCTF